MMVLIKQHRRDLRFSFLLGLGGGFLLSIALLTSPLPQPIWLVWAPTVVFPVVSTLGFLTFLIGGRWFSFLPQFARFCIVGFVSSSIEIALINILFVVSGHYDGVYFTVFKTITFTVALFSGYFFNRSWTFEGGGDSVHIEFTKYVGVNLIGILINVGTASFIVNVVGAPSGVSDFIWSNLGVLVAVFVTMLWNFIGYKFFVFSPKKSKMITPALQHRDDELS